MGAWGRVVLAADGVREVVAMAGAGWGAAVWGAVGWAAAGQDAAGWGAVGGGGGGGGLEAAVGRACKMDEGSI
jgi:hypothetical protein